MEMAPEIRHTRIINNALSNFWMGLAVRPLEERDIDVVFLGRWNAEKGIDVLLEYLETTTIAIRCEIYSDHVPHRRIKHAVVRPWAGEDTVRSVLGRSRVLVLPSYIEAYPTVLLEALACGTPFVASSIGGVPDIANESDGGVLVEPGDASALGSAIETLLADPTDWSRRSKLGWEWVNKRCNATRVLSLWKDAYASIEDRHCAR
jgi:glycosyltransferase involved in cell wall biosynthesis